MDCSAGFGSGHVLYVWLLPTTSGQGRSCLVVGSDSCEPFCADSRLMLHRLVRRVILQSFDVPPGQESEVHAEGDRLA